MGVFFILVSGFAVGLLAAIIWRQESGRNVVRQTVAGVLGALAGGVLAAAFLGSSGLFGGTYSIPSLLLTLLGAAIVVALLNTLRLAPSH